MKQHQPKSGSPAKRRKRGARRRPGVDVAALGVVETCPSCGGPVRVLVFVEGASA